MHRNGSLGIWNRGGVFSVNVGHSLRGSSERPTDVTLHSLEGVTIDNQLFSRVAVTQITTENNVRMDRLTILVLILDSDRLSSRPFVNVNDALRLYSIGPSRVTLCRFYRIAVNVQRRRFIGLS